MHSTTADLRKDLLRCPGCVAPLVAVPSSSPASAPGPAADLRCATCGTVYPSVDGLPCLLPEGQVESTDLTSIAFGRQWMLQADGSFEADTIYGETAEEEMQVFFARLGIEPGDLVGRRLLDIGCGSGRLTGNLARRVPQAIVVGGDRSDSARLAHRRCRDLPNALVVKLDLHRPPFAPETFDFIYADGVLPAVPDLEVGLRSLDRLLRPGGRLFMWTYPRTFSPYRLLRDVLIQPYRFPAGLHSALEWGLGLPLWAAFKLYEPLRGRRRRSLREVRFQLHDNFVPQYQHRRTPAQVAATLAGMGYVDIAAVGQATGVAGTKAPRPRGS